MNDYITSSPEKSIIKKICCDICDKETSIQYLATLVRYDKKKKKICFASLKELWKTGLLIKKYVEYPYNTEKQLENGFAEIAFYLKRGGYIVHFLDVNVVSDDIVYIKDIFMDSREIQFVSKGFSGDIVEERASIEQYCNRFLTSENKRLKLRFDVYCYIEESQICKRRIVSKKIGFRDEVLCLSRRKKFLGDSRQVLCEWFQLLTNVLEQRQEFVIDDDNGIIDSRDMELFLKIPNQNRKKYLHHLIKRYNRIIQRIGQLS